MSSCGCSLPYSVRWGWQIAVDLPVLEHAEGEVDVLAIHEETLIETSYLVKDLVWNEHESSRNDVDGSSLVLVEVLHVVTEKDEYFLHTSPVLGQQNMNPAKAMSMQ